MLGNGLTSGRLGQAGSDMLALKPYWGKPNVRNFRGGGGNVGIIRSPVRATALPDLFVGKLVARKRPMDLLVAMSRLKANANLVFGGEGSLRSDLERYALGKQLRNVFCLGFKNESDVAKYYAIADMFVLPSSHEVSPVGINEAMCWGLPVITPNAVPSAIDFVGEGQNGFTYKVGNIDELPAYHAPDFLDTRLWIFD